MSLYIQSHLCGLYSSLSLPLFRYNYIRWQESGDLDWPVNRSPKFTSDRSFRRLFSTLVLLHGDSASDHHPPSTIVAPHCPEHYTRSVHLAAGASRPAARCTHREGRKRIDREGCIPPSGGQQRGRRWDATRDVFLLLSAPLGVLVILVVVVVVVEPVNGWASGWRLRTTWPRDSRQRPLAGRIEREVECRGGRGGGSGGGDPMLAGAYSPSNAAGEREERTTAALQSARGVATQPKPRASRSRVLVIPSLTKLNEIADLSWCKYRSGEWSVSITEWSRGWKRKCRIAIVESARSQPWVSRW